LRVFENRSEVNTVCLMEGKMPESEDEIAIDRMYADNNNLKVGDTISEKSGKMEIADDADSENNAENSTDETTGGRSWKIVGLVALPDYSCLFSDNNDTMFDAVKFGVAIIPEGGLDAFSTDDLVYDYSWKYDTKPADDTEEKDMSEDLMSDLNGEVALQSFIPQYQNQAIHFTGDDMGSDRTMIIALLYIVIAILAFVFGITISNTISKEASVIGTLRASGYTKNELIRHYMAMPIIVTAISAVIGNILGYTVLKKVCAGMYYGSYSLPTYETIWSADAFVLTTIVPIIIMLVVNYVVLWKKLQLGPLKFLRRDLSGKKQRKIVPLSPKLPFFSRFQIRVLFQNMSNYVVLFIGIIFANMLLMFGLIFPSILNHYQESIPKQMICNYQYMLQVPIEAMDEEHKLESMIQMLLFSKAVETDNEDAEKFSAYSLEQSMSTGKKDGVTIYGVAENSRYIPIDFSDNVPNVYISSAYAEKYDLVIGDAISLKEPYGDDVYEFTVEGIYPYEAGIAVFMPQKELNQTFDLGDDYFCGYLSDTEITDIDAATVHKFQGREKENIIISTVDDEISDFADDPYLINVALSRAKKKLMLVVTGNEQSKERNITDLIDYIQYNNFEVTESKIYSIFDYLYKQYTEERRVYLQKHKKVSEYDSENLMYSLIEDIISANKYSSLDVVCHFPLNMLIKNPELLNEQECQYAMNPATHLDFLIYNRIGKKPVLAIEVDGYEYHKEDTVQASRDLLKNHIMELYEIPLLRFMTNGSGEREKIVEMLDKFV
jgi:putative ABC transport system permease protein